MNFQRLEEEITNIREQSRMYPFCSAGTPKIDNCYKKCKGASNCQAELVYYSPDQQDVFDCRKSTPKHIPKADACVKLANKNALVNGQAWCFRIDIEQHNLSSALPEVDP